MAKMMHRDRITGGYEYMRCPKCHTEIEINHPIKVRMPYCSECGRIILDAEQRYCCWCGAKFA